MKGVEGGREGGGGTKTEVDKERERRDRIREDEEIEGAEDNNGHTITQTP